MEPIRVMIVDDHTVFRDGLRILLASDPDNLFVGEATSGEEAVALADELRPDVILMDLQMPGMGGVEATRRILKNHPGTGILVVTMFEDDLSVFEAMRAGARGYLLKGAKHGEFLRAIRAVAEGEAIFSPSVAQRMVEYFSGMRPRENRAAFPELSEREREVLVLMARGVGNAGIAEQLFLSPKTVRNYVTTILSKLQAADRAEAIIKAREAGLG